MNQLNQDNEVLMEDIDDFKGAFAFLLKRHKALQAEQERERQRTHELLASVEGLEREK